MSTSEHPDPSTGEHSNQSTGEYPDPSASEHLDPDLVALGQAVREQRKQHGMTVDKLAKKAGIDRKRLATLEAGRLDPAYDLLLALAKGLGVALEELVRRAKELRSC